MSSYKCWSPDLCIEEEDGKIIAKSWFDAEDAAHEYVDNNFYDWESPEGPFNIHTYECTPDGQRAGKTKIFKVFVEYTPDFWLTEQEEKNGTS